MKVLALLCLAGLALASRSSGDSSEWYFQSGKEYVYQYSGRLLTGLPQLADVFSGVAVNCTVHLQRTSGSDTFSLTIRNPKYVRVNEKLDSLSQREHSNWRQLRLPELSEVGTEFSSVLEKPILFTMINGEIKSAKVSKDEPVWSVNFKKALALQFQTKMDSSSPSWQQLQQQQQKQQQDQNQQQQPESDESITYWKVKEETIDGVCENIYEVRELPKYIISDRPEIIPFPEACPEERYYGLTKTKDVAKCEKRSSFYYFAPGHYGYQLTGNNMDMWSRSSNTRIIACGTRGKLVIQTIVNDGELNQNLLGYNSERFVTGTMQVFRLKEIRDSSSPSDESSGNYITLNSMMFEHSKESMSHEQTVQQQMNNLNQEDRIKLIQSGRIPEHLVGNPEVVRQALPRNFMYGVSSEDVSSEEIKPQLKKYISEIVRELTAGVDTKDKQITSKIMAASRGFLLLKSKDDIRSVYEELKSEFSSNPEDLVSMKTIFFDTLLTSGCPKCILFIKESIMSGEVSTTQISNIFVWMANYVKMPTGELLSSLYELVTCDKVRENKHLYNRAIMGYSSLLNKACISPYRKTMYPINVFGEFCNPDSEIVVSKWIPYLVHDLKYDQSLEKRNEIIVSLGLMQHKSVIGELLPFVEGSVEGTTKLNRLLAIHSLSNAALSMDPTHVVPIFFSILSNPSESTSLRIAAFNSLMKQNPSMTVMHKIASLSWTVKDQELLKVINLAFFTLSKESEKIANEETTLTLSKKAALVYPLIKKTLGVIPTSATIFSGDVLRKMGVGYEAKTSWTASKTSFLPQDYYTEMTYFMSQFKFTPLAFGVHLSGADNLYNEIQQIMKPVEQQNQQEEDEEQQQQQEQKINQEWRNIIDQLKIKARESGPMDGAFFFRWFESSPFFYNFDKVTPKQLREKLAPLLANPQKIKDKLCGSFPMNAQQTLDRIPNVFMIPSDMGFPIVIEVLMPVAFSIRGKLNIDCQSEIPSVSMKATVVANAQYSGWVGTSIPFTKEYAVTGVQEEMIANVPINAEVKVDLSNGQLSFSMKPEIENLNKPTDLYHFHVRPFITYKKVADLTPLTLTPSIKTIRSNQELKKMSYSMGGEYFGLGLKHNIETESPYTDLRACLDQFSLYNNNPLNMVRFLWPSVAMRENGLPSFRSNSHSITLDPSESSTKEIQFDVKIGVGKKSKGDQQIKYKTVQLKNKQQQQQQQQQLKNLNPFQVVSHNNEEKNVHPRRQEKIQKQLQKLNVESGYAVSAIFTTTLKGSRSRSMTYAMTLATGQESHSSSHGIVKSKWDYHFESETSTPCPVKQICVKGEIDMPVLPLWNIEELRSSLIDFRYMNEISFGKSSCSESSIKVVGNAKVSHEQKEFSRQSADARKCHELLENRAPGAKLSDACQRTRLQAETVDEVEFKMEYNNVPKEVTQAERKLIEFMKICLWPYIKAVKSNRHHMQQQHQQQQQEERNSFPVMVRVLFHRETPSFDLIINKPDESIAFSKIRIPYPLNLVFPMKAGTCPNTGYQIAKSLSGGALTPECKVGSEMLTTFDNKSMPIKMDDCFHLLSGDCSKHRSFGILARNLKHDNNKREVKVFLGKASVLLTPTEQRSENPEIKVTVNREELEVPSNTWRSIKVDNQEIGSIFRSIDNVFELKSSQYHVQFRFDGTRVVVYASQLLKDKLCGLCGNFNQLSKDDMTGPSKCIHAKPQVQIASYRVQTQHCERLPSHIERELEQEREQCVHFKEIPTQIIKSLKAQAGHCTVRKHIVVEKPGQVCISKSQVTECQTACKVAEGKKVAKAVEFTCFNQGRIAELYVQKANSGQELPELRNLETSFESKVEQPKKCISAILKN